MNASDHLAVQKLMSKYPQLAQLAQEGKHNKQGHVLLILSKIDPAHTARILELTGTSKEPLTLQINPKAKPYGGNGEDAAGGPWVPFQVECGLARALYRWAHGRQAEGIPMLEVSRRQKRLYAIKRKMHYRIANQH